MEPRRTQPFLGCLFLQFLVIFLIHALSQHLSIVPEPGTYEGTSRSSYKCGYGQYHQAGAFLPEGQERYPSYRHRSNGNSSRKKEYN